MARKKYKWTQEELDNIFDFIKENRDKFDVADPSKYHGTHFFNKLGRRFKKAYVSIRPHITKSVVATIMVWFLSFVAWGNWINPDRDKKTYGSVDFEHRMTELKYQFYIVTLRFSLRFNHLKGFPEIRKEINNDLKEMDLYYDDLQRDLKQNPNNNEIINFMETYYKMKLKTLYDYISFYKERENIALLIE